MEIADQEVWEKWKETNQDIYGATVLDYAKKWAELMEDRIAEGEKLEDVAKETSHQANTMNITGFMYGSAVSVLASCWEYGERLRKWNNAKYIGKEDTEPDGVVNPALLEIKE